MSIPLTHRTPSSSLTRAYEKKECGTDANRVSGTPEWDTYIESCGYAVDEFFWLNSLHPTYPIHDVVAEGVAALLSGPPNV